MMFFLIVWVVIKELVMVMFCVNFVLFFVVFNFFLFIIMFLNFNYVMYLSYIFLLIDNNFLFK